MNAPLLAANNLTVAAGALTGVNNITINGGNVSGNASINLTGGTFLLDGAGSFGGSGNWTFNNLTFGDGSGTATTTVVGGGSVTVAGTATIAANQMLDAGGKTWILRGAEPLTINGTLNFATSTIAYASLSALEIPPLAFYNLSLTPAGSVIYTLGTTTGQTFNIGNNLVIGDGTYALTANTQTYSPIINVSGDLTVNSSAALTGTATTTINGGDVGGYGTINLTGGTFLVDGTGSFGGSGNWTFNNLTFGDGSGSATSSASGSGEVTANGALTVASNQVLDAGSKRFNLGASSNPFIISGSFLPSSGAIAYTTASSTNILPMSYYNLVLAPAAAGSPTYTLGTTTGQTVTVNGGLTIGDGTYAVTVTAGTNNPILHIGGAFVINSSATFVAPGSSLFKVDGNFTNSGTFTHNSGTVTVNGSGTSLISGATTFNNFTSTTGGKTIKFQRQASGNPVFTFAGILTLTGAPNDNINLQSDSFGTQWLAHFNTAQSEITHTRIRDSGCDAGSANLSLLGSGSKDDGNNGNCWVFSSSSSYEGGSGGGQRAGSDGSGQSSEGGSGGGTPQGGGDEGGGGPPPGGGGGGGTPQGGGSEGGFIPSDRHFADYYWHFLDYYSQGKVSGAFQNK